SRAVAARVTQPQRPRPACTSAPRPWPPTSATCSPSSSSATEPKPPPPPIGTSRRRAAAVMLRSGPESVVLLILLPSFPATLGSVATRGGEGDGQDRCRAGRTPDGVAEPGPAIPGVLPGSRRGRRG